MKNYGQVLSDSKFIKMSIGLLAIILVVAFLARSLSGSETLQDYAESNPEVAYSTTVADAKKAKEKAEKELLEEKLEKQQQVNNEDATTGAEQNDTSVSCLDDAKNLDSTNIEGYSEASADRVTFNDGFYYESLTDSVKARITGISYPESLNSDPDAAITYEDLRLLSVLYYDFNNEVQMGKMICNKLIAQDLVEIFYELYRNGYQIEKISLIDEYNGDDELSMEDNNSSCFNYRVIEGTTKISNHAYGLAVDINPFYNPYIVYGKGENGSDYVTPIGSEEYVDRSRDFAYKIDSEDLCYKLFIEHGFTWGGNWNSCKDYQHFEKTNF